MYGNAGSQVGLIDRIWVCLYEAIPMWALLRATMAEAPMCDKVPRPRDGLLAHTAREVLRAVWEGDGRMSHQTILHVVGDQDVLQIHNSPDPSPPQLEGRSYTQLWIADYLRPGGALEGLQRVLRGGKTRYGGFICRGNDAYQVRQLIDTDVFHMINVPYTLLNPTAGMAKPEGLEVDRDFGGVINYT